MKLLKKYLQNILFLILAPHKSELVEDDWIKRYNDTSNLLLDLSKTETNIDPTVVSLSCFISSLSTYSSACTNFFVDFLFSNLFLLLGSEVSEKLTDGGAANWIFNNLKMSAPKSYYSLPRGIRLLLQDQLLQSFSSPSSMDISLSQFGIYDVGTCFNSSKPLDYKAAFSLLTVGELARYRK